MGYLSRSGVSLAALRSIAEETSVEARTVDVVNRIIRPETVQKSCAYVELLPDEQRGPPNVFVVHAWTGSWRGLVEQLALARPADDEASVFVWLDVIACSLHEADKTATGATADGAEPSVSTRTEASALVTPSLPPPPP